MGNFALKGQKHYCIRAFALSGRMNPTGHNTTGRCPGLCAFAPSGRYRANIKPQILGILGISITSASEKIPLICEILWLIIKFRFFRAVRVQEKTLRLCAFALKTSSSLQLPSNSLPNPMQIPFLSHPMKRTFTDFGADL